MKQSNLLLVGLGGTGCAVVRELKKKLYVEWRSRGNTGPYPETYEFEDNFGGERVTSRIATLSVDSNDADLSGAGERARAWRVFGETLKLADKEKVLINPVGIDRILTSIERYPGIEPWIRDDLGFVQDITRGSTKPNGCNQIRRMGRLALANANSIENVIRAIADRLSALSRDGKVGAEIHVACTLAAGTGSGALIDTLAQIQKHLKTETGDYELYVHGFATAKDVGDVNTGNFYANQFGALLELNAFRLGLYRPWDITASPSPRRLAVPEPGRSTGDLAGTYKSVALITETTEGHSDIRFEQQIENVAEFLFQLSVRQMGNLPKELRDALSMEDRATYPTDVNGGIRSTAFIAYGVQRVAIPEREIREKLSYAFGRQFLLKLLYHNWDNGYRESPRAFSRDNFVDVRRQVWRATREHLYLDVVEDESGNAKFDTYEVEWRNALAQEARETVEDLGDAYDARKVWLDDFDHRANVYWEQGFRSRGDGGGVNDYFKIRMEATDVSQRAVGIRSAIERDLLVNIERMNPEYPLHGLPDALEFLIGRVEEDRLWFGGAAGESVDEMKEADRLREGIREQYDKAGRWAGGKHERLFNEYITATTRYYFWATEQRAAEYGQRFCATLVDELKSLQQQVALFDTRLKQTATSFATEIESRINASAARAVREDITYVVDVDYVNDAILKRFIANKSIQDLRADAAMERLKQMRGDRYEFRLYTERMPVDDTERVGGPLVDALRRISEDNALEAHRKMKEDDPNFDGILGQNIVRKLYTEYGGRTDGDLESWIRNLIERSMPMVSFQPNEERMDLPTQGPVLRRCVFVPKCSSVPDEFEEQLRRRVESTTGSQGGCKEVETYFREVPEERNPTEISILSVAFFFSARFARVTHGLRAEYRKRLDQRSAEDSKRGYFECHTESHRPPLPDLMKESRETVLLGQMPVCLLATAMGLMQIPDQDGREILFGVKDRYGRVEDKVSSGMRLSTKVRDAAAQSEERYGHPIPIETVIIHSLYRKEFQEDALSPLAGLLRARYEKEDFDPERLEQRLSAMSGEFFLLSGSNEDDAGYRELDTQMQEAMELSRHLGKNPRM
jgi:hypothetical protein